MVAELLGAKQCRMQATTSCDDDQTDISEQDIYTLEVSHHANAPITADIISLLSSHYGSIIQPLQELYQQHNGITLFIVDNEPSLYILPIHEWKNYHEDVMRWASDVTWQDAPEDMPSWLESAIPFAVIPGDYERLIFITEGPYAGKIMLSDTDVIENEPRFDSIQHFLATLLCDAPRFLDSGGYVRYQIAGLDKPLYPLNYLYEK